jgi:hypothetical protein
LKLFSDFDIQISNLRSTLGASQSPRPGLAAKTLTDSNPISHEVLSDRALKADTRPEVNCFPCVSVSPSRQLSQACSDVNLFGNQLPVPWNVWHGACSPSGQSNFGKDIEEDNDMDEEFPETNLADLFIALTEEAERSPHHKIDAHLLAAFILSGLFGNFAPASQTWH